MSLISVAVAIFFIMNPFGNIPIFLSLLGKYPVKKQLAIIFRELAIALFIMMLFAFFGNHILDTIGISSWAVKVAGGLILIIIALNLIFSIKDDSHSDEDEPFIVPLAIPIMAGPGTIATIISYAHQIGSPLNMIAVLLMAWVSCCVILLLAPFIGKFLKPKALHAAKELGGLILIFLGMQMMFEGAVSAVEHIRHISG